MNKIKVAKQLIKLAKSLIIYQEDEEKRYNEVLNIFREEVEKLKNHKINDFKIGVPIENGKLTFFDICEMYYGRKKTKEDIAKELGIKYSEVQ